MTTPSPLEPFVLPDADFARSPRTGWTRDHWEATADRWLAQVDRYSSPAGGIPQWPGRVTGDGVGREGMEAVGRSFLLAAPRIAGAEDRAADELAARYSRALLAGTKPGGVEEWPLGVICRSPITGVANSIVEAANIAFGLFVSKDHFWVNLSRTEQRQIADWLRHHARLEVWHNNWQLFPAMAEAFLRSVGEDTSGCIGARNVARVESWHLEQGWYTDGPEHAIDYYNAWAIHPYLWAWYRMTDATRTPEGSRHLERLHDFVDSYTGLFAPDGSMMHIGRSLPYRTAALAALWCAELSEVNPLTPGQTRRLASGALARFVENGVGIDEPLSLGWYRPYEPMSQTYSGYGSPFLAGIGFLGLAMDRNAAVWTDVEEDQPTDAAPSTSTLPSVGWIVTSQNDGVVRLVNHGSDHCGMPVEPSFPDPDDPHYAKFAYSTHTAPGTGQAWIDNVDSHLALVGEDGRASRRCAIRGMRTEGTLSGSVHLPQLDGRLLPGCAVTTVSAVDGLHELRAHLVEAPTAWNLREGGFAVADDVELEQCVDATAPLATVRNRDGLTAEIRGVHGWTGVRTFAYDDANAMGTRSAAPALLTTGGAGRTVVVSLHTLSRENVTDTSAVVTVSVDGTTVHARWRSGAVHTIDLATFVPWDGQLPSVL